MPTLLDSSKEQFPINFLYAEETNIENEKCIEVSFTINSANAKQDDFS